jgi:hypothetical protein
MATKTPKPSKKPAKPPRMPLSKAFSSSTAPVPKPAEPQQIRMPSRRLGIPVR